MIHDSTDLLLMANRGKLPVQVWEPDSQAITMTAKSCEVEWGLDMNTAASPPLSPVACVKNGTVNQVRLVVRDVRSGSGVTRNGVELPRNGRDLTTKVGEQPWPQLVHCASIDCRACGCVFQED